MRLIAAVLALTLVACEEQASFGDKTERRKPRPTEDGEVNTEQKLDPQGRPIQVDETGNPYVVDETGAKIPVDEKGNPIPGGTPTDGDPVLQDGTKPPQGNPNDPDGMPNDNAREWMTRDKTFPTYTTGDATATQSLGDAYLMQTVPMERLYFDRMKSMTQLIRPKAQDNHEQGFGGTVETEPFDQVANRALDILIVVDDSESMAEEQANLSTKLAPLLQSIEQADWRIGVVTTWPEITCPTTQAPNQPCLRALIKKGDPDVAQKFARAVTPGTFGGFANNERGVLTAVRALSSPDLPMTWVRPDSTIGILVVTDEDNCSDGTSANCPGKPYLSGNYLIDYLRSIGRLPGQNARVYGLFWHPSQTAAQCPTAYNKANIWASVVSSTMGTWGSICDADYTPTLASISRDMRIVLNTRFTLKYMPDPGSVRVFVDDVELTSGFTVTGKLVEINPAPREGARIVIKYTRGATPLLRAFALRATPLDGTLEVKVNDTVVPASEYVFDREKLLVTFNVPPASRAAIVFTYTRDVALLKQFVIGEAVVAGSVAAKVDGVDVTDFTVLEANGAVTFAEAPMEGAPIIFTYKAVGPIISTYPFVTADGGAPMNLKAYDEDMDPVTVSYVTPCPAGIAAPSCVTFGTENFQEGTSVTVRYDNVARQRFSIVLPSDPIPGSVTAEARGSVCSGLEQVTVVGRQVDVQGCGFSEDVDMVTIRYKHVTATLDSFTFDLPNLPGPGDRQVWKVFVDGKESNAWTRDGNRISFGIPLPPFATVKIQLMQEVN